MIKKILIACIALFLLIGVVAASENKTDVANANGDTIEAENTAPVKQTTQVKETPTKEIAKKESKITVKSVKGKEGKNVKIKAVLKDSDGKLIKNKKVTFKIKGKKYTARTNDNGKATIAYKLPKAKYFKTVKTKKGKYLTKKQIYRTANTVKITFDGTGKYQSSSATAKVISKKTVTKKYKYKRFVRKEVVPCERGDHEYVRGPVVIEVIFGKDYGSDDLWIAVDTKDHKLRLQSAAKLHSQDKHGNWKWDKEWTHDMSEHDWIVTFYGDLPKTDKIKVRYTLGKYVRIK